MKYATYKTFHNWLGIFLLLPIILTSLTGVLWMHEKVLGIKSVGEKPMTMAKATGSVVNEGGSKVEDPTRWTPDAHLKETRKPQEKVG